MTPKITTQTKILIKDKSLENTSWNSTKFAVINDPIPSVIIYFLQYLIFNDNKLISRTIFTEWIRRMGRQCCWLGGRNNKRIWRSHKNIEGTKTKRKRTATVWTTTKENRTQFKTTTIRSKIKFLMRRKNSCKNLYWK